MAKTRLKATVGLSYGGKRVEAGEYCDDVPEESREWLFDQGLIEEVSPSKKRKAKKKATKKKASR